MCANPMSDMFVHNPNFNLTSFEHLDKYLSAARRQNVGDKIIGTIINFIQDWYLIYLRIKH